MPNPQILYIFLDYNPEIYIVFVDYQIIVVSLQSIIKHIPYGFIAEKTTANLCIFAVLLFFALECKYFIFSSYLCI